MDNWKLHWVTFPPPRVTSNYSMKTMTTNHFSWYEANIKVLALNLAFRYLYID